MEKQQVTSFEMHNNEIIVAIKCREKENEVGFDNYHIRKMKTKWGSCNDEKRTLHFNIELIKKPAECIEYIVVHEMVHLLVRNHNQDFIILMDKFLPNWRSLKQRLNELPTTFNY